MNFEALRRALRSKNLQNIIVGISATRTRPAMNRQTFIGFFGQTNLLLKNRLLDSANLRFIKRFRNSVIIQAALADSNHFWTFNKFFVIVIVKNLFSGFEMTLFLINMLFNSVDRVQTYDRKNTFAKLFGNFNGLGRSVFLGADIVYPDSGRKASFNQLFIVFFKRRKIYVGVGVVKHGPAVIEFLEKDR